MSSSDEARARITLDEISPASWEHPTDRAALHALRQIPGFDSLLRKVVGAFGEKNIAVLYQAAAVQVGPEQYPQVHQSLVRVCEILDTEVPPLYISQTSLANAGAVGMDKPFIVLNSSLIELTHPGELEAVIAHEVGHILSEHALYRTLLFLLLDFSSSTLPIVSQATTPITLALLEWHRKSEISCDRAGLLGTQDLEAALGVQAVLAGGIRGKRDELNLEAFLEQCDNYRSLNGLGGYYKMMSTLGRSHPFPVIRAVELRDWVASGDYQSILAGEYARRGESRSVVEDITDAGRHFSDRAAQVFEDSDRYVNEALVGFAKSAKKFLG